MTTQHQFEKHSPAAPGEEATQQTEFAIGACVISRVGRERGFVAHWCYGLRGHRVYVVDVPCANGSRRKCCYLAAELELCDAN